MALWAFHHDTIDNLPSADIVGICDIDENQLSDVPKHIKTYVSAKDMLDDTQIDAVIIAVNNNQHRLLTEIAAKSGKHILCEKPVALSVEDLDFMQKCCDENNVSFTVHQQR